MARKKRDYKKEYVRRNELARLKGYKSYYDYRLHRHGRRPPGTPVPETTRSAAGGKRGTRALLGLLEGGEVEDLHVLSFGPEPSADIMVQMTDGSTKEFKVRGADSLAQVADAATEFGLQPVGSPKAIKAFGSFAEEEE